MAFFFPLRAAAHESHISHPVIHTGGQLCLEESLVKDHNPSSDAFLQTEGSTVPEDYPISTGCQDFCPKLLVTIYSKKSQRVKNC